MSSADEGDDVPPASGGGSGSDGEPAGDGKRVLTKRKLEKLQARAAKKGVCYLSRVPPFMKPVKLRHLLEQHGEVLRIYLAAEGACCACADAAHSGAAAGKARSFADAGALRSQTRRPA